MSKFNPDNIRVVVIDRAHAHWSNLQLRGFFGDVLGLRLTGYGLEYPAQVIPLDASDYFATHIVTCEELPQGQLVPLSSYKMVSARRCIDYKREFTGLQVPLEAGSAPHASVVKDIVDSALSRGLDIGYCCSWTIHPRARENELLTQLIRNIVYCTHWNWQLEFGIQEMLIAGVERFKTDKYQESIGYKRLTSEGEILQSFGHRDLWGEAVVMLHMTAPSEKTLSLTRRYQHLWDERIQLGDARQTPIVKDKTEIAVSENNLTELKPLKKAA